MNGKKTAGILMMLPSGAGLCYAAYTVIAEINKTFTYQPPFTDHEKQILMIGAASLVVFVIGLILLAGSSSRKPVTGKPEPEKAVTSDPPPVRKSDDVSTPRLIGDLARKVQKDPSELEQVVGGSGSGTSRYSSLAGGDGTRSADGWVCPRCETIVEEDVAVCPVCGQVRATL